MGVNVMEDKTESILIISSEINTQKKLEKIFDKDFIIYYYSSLEKFISEKKLNFDLIIFDLALIKTGSLNIFEQIKVNEKLQKTPFIYISNGKDDLKLIEFFDTSFDDYINKPFNDKEVFFRVNKTLTLKKIKDRLITHYMEQEKDLIYAKTIQQGILTKQNYYDKINNIEFSIKYIPFNDLISGDYYNISNLEDSSTGIFIADATGHGIQAALTTMQIDLLVKESSKLKYPNKRFEYINNKFVNQLKSRNFFTGFFINIYNTHIYYSSAGHPEQYLIKKNKVLKLKTKGATVGVIENSIYGVQKLELNSGDILILYTDGLIEQRLTNETVLQTQKLYNILDELSCKNIFNESVSEINNYILERMQIFSEQIKKNDDVTLIVMRKN